MEILYFLTLNSFLYFVFSADVLRCVCCILSVQMYLWVLRYMSVRKLTNKHTLGYATYVCKPKKFYLYLLHFVFLNTLTMGIHHLHISFSSFLYRSLTDSLFHFACVRLCIIRKCIGQLIQSVVLHLLCMYMYLVICALYMSYVYIVYIYTKNKRRRRQREKKYQYNFNIKFIFVRNVKYKQQAMFNRATSGK